MESLKRAEELRRERMWEPLERWRAIMRTISWAERQGAGTRNERAARLREQAHKLAALTRRA
jgi:hypothetical protein